MKSENNFLNELLGALICAALIGLPFAMYFISMRP
jgi:hypothetical protein